MNELRSTGAINVQIYSGLRWYVARTRPMAEHAVRRSLERGGYEVFLPRVGAERPRPGRSDAPLFPGYLFLRYDLAAWGPEPLERVPRLLGLVSFGDVAPPLPDDEVEELRRRVAEFNRMGWWSRLRPGDHVRLRVGRADGLAGTVTEVNSGTGRVRVLARFLGRLAAAEAHAGDARTTAGETSQRPGRAPRRTRGRGRWIKGFGPRAGEGDAHDSS